MTACAIEPTAGDRDGDLNGGPRGALNGGPGGARNGYSARPGCVITVDGGYAARLARSGDSWFPERWTLDGPEPYAVPLPGNQPEEPGTEVQPMTDGRVLIRRHADGRHLFSLLYPTGPGTGELPLGAVECGDAELRLLPPAPGGHRAYALAAGPRSATVWLVAGGAFGPERVAEVPGHCSGGVWLDRAGRMLALDRALDGRTKAVVVDLERGGQVSPLLQIAAGSDDRLLLADPDSGLLLIRSDAPSPGHARLGWGVLGSTLPVRFPDCLRVAEDCAVTPFAIQPGQVLTPESCGVALRFDGPAGSWIGVWRPAQRQVAHLPAPQGWLAGVGLWTRDGVLRLPYATPGTPCGVAEVAAPERGEGGPESEREPEGERERERERESRVAGGADVGGGGHAGPGGGDGVRGPAYAWDLTGTGGGQGAWAGPGAVRPAEGLGTARRTEGAEGSGTAGAVGAVGVAGAVGAVGAVGDVSPEGPVRNGTASPSGKPSEPDPPAPAAPRPVPLQQAPLAGPALGRLVTK
ncbi:hypothetical protein [Streptomyces sp. JB150]|uniref:hypothetical protein n=1 Tax=Streptomyces sp. JB150 TaxID=2714844 RepID=UPI001F0F0C49|nr:hypothetical protein [Streptomyces sp. JB150]